MSNKYTSDFHRFVNEAWIEYERLIGSRGTVSKFAKMTGANQGDMSWWLNGGRRPAEKAVRKMVEHLTTPRDNPDEEAVRRELVKFMLPDIWVKLGMAIPTNSEPQERILRLMTPLPMEWQESIAQDAERRAAEHQKQQNERQNQGRFSLAT